MKNRLKELRVAKKLSQKDFAKAFNKFINENSDYYVFNGKGQKKKISYATVSRWENNRTPIPTDYYKSLADFLEVPINYLQGLTMGRKDILRVLNNAYYDFLKYPKVTTLIGSINDLLALLDIPSPKDSLTMNDLNTFSVKACNYWDKNFDFLFVCDQITYLLDLPRKSVSNERMESQIISAIEETEIALTSTEISKLFDKEADFVLKDYYFNREKLVRFNTKDDIELYTFNLMHCLNDFLNKMQKLPENSKKQYTPQIAQKRLNELIEKKKKAHLYNYPA